MAHGEDFCNQKGPQANFFCEKTAPQALLIKENDFFCSFSHVYIYIFMYIYINIYIYT